MSYEATLDELLNSLLLLSRQGRLGEATIQCDEIEADAIRCLARINTVRAYIADYTSSPDDRIRHLKKAIQIDPTYQAAYFELMTAAAKMGDTESISTCASELISVERQLGTSAFTEMASAFLSYSFWKRGNIEMARRGMISFQEVDDAIPLLGTGLTVGELRKCILGCPA